MKFPTANYDILVVFTCTYFIDNYNMTLSQIMQSLNALQKVQFSHPIPCEDMHLNSLNVNFNFKS